MLTKFESIRSTNTKYSLRRFAHDIGLSPSNLSDIFKGRCGLSADGARKIAESLRMGENEKLYFLDLVESRHARNRAEREAAQRRLQERETAPFKSNATDDQLRVIDQWYYLAALEMIQLVDGKLEDADLAVRLRISLEEAREACTVLMKLGLVKLQEGRYVRERQEFAVTTPTPSSAIRGYHHQMLKLGDAALESQPMEKRQFSSTLMTFDSRRLEEARTFLIEMENEFFRRFEAKPGEGDSVHALNYQYFRLDEELL